MKKYAVIVAGGSGSRMGGPIPKQFLPIGSKPVLMHTLQQFLQYPEPVGIILVLPPDQIQAWENLCTMHAFHHSVKVIPGGSSRFQSVKKGLGAIEASEGLIAIHDGVRPFIKHAVIKESYETAALKGNAIVSVPLKESIRSVHSGESKSEDRSRFRLIQTPQTFRLELIRDAYKTPELPLFTDDASVLEYAGEKIHLIDGSYENIKITTPEDLVIAEALLGNWSGMG